MKRVESDVPFISVDSMRRSTSIESSPKRIAAIQQARESVRKDMAEVLQECQDQPKMENSMSFHEKMKQSKKPRHTSEPENFAPELAGKANATKYGGMRRLFAKVIFSPVWQAFLTLIITAHLFVSIHETNQRSLDQQRGKWQEWLDSFFMVSYFADLVMRLYVNRGEFFKVRMNVFDLAIVILDVCLSVLELIFPQATALRVLRGARALRIVRVIRKFTVLRDLYLMIQGIFNSLQPIFFATMLIGVVLTLFSIVAVEVIHPLNAELAIQGWYDSCERCPVAFQTVVASCLTFTQTIIAGDSWGVLAIPLLRNHPLTAFVLVPVFVLVQLGLMNVIVAVVVDRQTAARDEDRALQQTMKEEQQAASYKQLLKLCNQIDSDGDGMITAEELYTNPDLVELLHYMEVQKRDLPLIFQIIDIDGDGNLSNSEFVEMLYEMKTADTKTITFINRKQTDQICSMVSVMADFMEHKFDEFDKNFALLLKEKDMEPKATAYNGENVCVKDKVCNTSTRCSAPGPVKSSLPKEPEVPPAWTRGVDSCTLSAVQTLSVSAAETAWRAEQLCREFDRLTIECAKCKIVNAAVAPTGGISSSEVSTIETNDLSRLLSDRPSSDQSRMYAPGSPPRMDRVLPYSSWQDSSRLPPDYAGGGSAVPPPSPRGWAFECCKATPLQARGKVEVHVASGEVRSALQNQGVGTVAEGPRGYLQ